MRSSFDQAFEIAVGLEGKISTDARDPGNYYPDGSPGGFTIYGLSTRYNKTLRKDMSIEEVKDIYLYSYWIPAGCDDAPFPMDIVLFDIKVNPIHGGIKPLMAQHPENWQDLLLLRAEMYMKHSDSVYVKGHVFRCLRLFRSIRELL
jgi:hypothetical protein